MRFRLFVLIAVLALFAAPGAWSIWGRRASHGPEIEFRVARAWGLPGAQPGQMNLPRAILPAPDGSIYVIDRSGHVQRFSCDGALAACWRLPAWQSGTPTGVCFDAQGGLVVADCHYARLLFYTPDGQFERQFGEYGEAPGQMIFPTGVALGPDGALYVTERGGRDRVQKFSPDGAFLQEWGGFGDQPGQFMRPMGLAFDDRGRLWVADAGNHRLQIFDTEGNVLRAFGQRGKAPGEFDYPYDVAAGPGGVMLVVEYGNNRVQFVSPGGASLGVLGAAGREPGQFASPWGVAVDKDHLVWVADTLNNRLQAIEVDWKRLIEEGRMKDKGQRTTD
ncbi:MAG: hypothetical protein NTW86_20010 [Candidatus Sumerlaeota bacterium]|nr:hypothetical protein [Candidatus Sumerlaeota bacterium]